LSPLKSLRGCGFHSDYGYVKELIDKIGKKTTLFFIFKKVFKGIECEAFFVIMVFKKSDLTRRKKNDLTKRIRKEILIS
jgi:hypothetical protein